MRQLADGVDLFPVVRDTFGLIFAYSAMANGIG